jgi:hypothetical protein
MARLRSYVPLLAALLAGACGAGAHSKSTPAARGLPSDPSRAVRQALASLSKRSFDESFTQVTRFHVTGVAPAKAAQLNSRLRSIDTSESGLVQFSGVRDFQARITSSDSGTQYVKASGGSFLVSSDGVHYQPAPAGEQGTFTSLAQSGLSLLARGMTNVRDGGARTVNGTAAEEYAGVIPASAMRSQFGSLIQLPAGSSLGPGTLTVDVSRAAVVPVHMVDVISLTMDLAALHQPGLSGHATLVETSTRAFAHFGPVR